MRTNIAKIFLYNLGTTSFEGNGIVVACCGGCGKFDVPLLQQRNQELRGPSRTEDEEVDRFNRRYNHGASSRYGVRSVIESESS